MPDDYHRRKFRVAGVRVEDQGQRFQLRIEVPRRHLDTVDDQLVWARQVVIRAFGKS